MSLLDVCLFRIPCETIHQISGTRAASLSTNGHLVSFLDPPPRAADKWGSSEWLHDMITWLSCTGMGNESAVHVIAYKVSKRASLIADDQQKI